MIPNLISNSALPTGLLGFSAHPSSSASSGLGALGPGERTLPGHPTTGPVGCVREPRFTCPASDCYGFGHCPPSGPSSCWGGYLHP